MEFSEKEIQDYIHDRLSEEEKIAFEDKAKSDPQLAEQLKNALLLKEGLSVQNEKILFERMESLEDSLTTNNTNVIPWFRWAAAIVLLAIPIYYFTSQSVSPEELYNDYYTPYENVLGATRGDHESSYMESYEKGNYEAAISELQDAIISAENSQDYSLYLGISYLEEGQYEEARQAFSSIESTNRFYNHARWYSALAYLKTGNVDEARSIFADLKEGKSSFSENASKILEALD